MRKIFTFGFIIVILLLEGCAVVPSYGGGYSPYYYGGGPVISVPLFRIESHHWGGDHYGHGRRGWGGHHWH